MIRIKTLTLPVVSALVASVLMPAQADVAMQLSSHKAYRQNKTGATAFRGGVFDIYLRDGNGVYVGGCARDAYWPPNIPLDPCPGGSTAYVIYGDIDEDVPRLGPYFWMTDVIPALIIEPRRPDLCLLKAAPPSDLGRPYGGFKDYSYGVYYNLHTTNVWESVITRYETHRTYNANQLGKFEDEIVPGVYHYAFPRLGYPNLNVPISPVIYPIAEGYATKNNQKTGVRFTANSNWTKNGFMELSYIRPNVIKWSGFSPTVVFPSVDKLYFSMRYLQDPKNPLSELSYTNPDTFEAPASLFPSFVSGGDPRILLANPFVTSFTMPPIFPGGSTAVIELELDRGFQTGGVTYDFSTRRFQIPVIVVNRYSEYAEMRFGTGARTAILADYDKDGYNNLNEWILDSRADDSASVPIDPFPFAHPAVINPITFEETSPAYYGFTVKKKRGTVPIVYHMVQRSIDGGKTWQKFGTNALWKVTNSANQIRVESAVLDDNNTPLNPFDDFQIEPPGTAGHLYRVKITLKR